MKNYPTEEQFQTLREGLRVHLRLIEARPLPSGVVLMRYARA